MGTITTDTTTQVPPPESLGEISAWRRRLEEAQLSLRLLLKSPLAATGLIIVLLYVGIALYAQFFIPDNGTMIAHYSGDIFPAPPILWPGGSPAGGLLGTTYPAISLADAIPKAIRIDLIASAFVVLIGALVGTLIGVYSGYKGGLFDEALMRVTDVTYSIPFLVFAIAVAFVFGHRDFLTLNLVLLVLWWPPYARLVRAQSLSVKETKFVEAARAAGASDARIMVRHVLPNTLAPVFVQISLDLGAVTQIFAALNFIGFALDPLLPELGNLINVGYKSGFVQYPWTVLIPGIVLLIFTVGVNLLGDGLRDVLDPRLRR